MGWVYILQSLSNGRFYIGSTVDLERRLAEHQRGHSPATRGRGPWRLAYQECFPSLIEARKRELQLKRCKSAKVIQQMLHSPKG